MGLVKVESVTKTYGQRNVLDSVSLTLDESSQYAIMGSSGSGKSTLLYLLGGLDRANSGKIMIGGKDLSTLSDEELARYRNELIGFVFQFHFLLPSMTCLDNILLPAQIGRSVSKGLREQTLQRAEVLGVANCLNKFPYQLSGGEQQRINIIRALSMRPKLLLCDEPTGSLDSENSEVVVKLLKSLCEENNATLVVVTHDDQVANQFFQRILLKDGRII